MATVEPTIPQATYSTLVYEFKMDYDRTETMEIGLKAGYRTVDILVDPFDALLKVSKDGGAYTEAEGYNGEFSLMCADGEDVAFRVSCEGYASQERRIPSIDREYTFEIILDPL